MHHIALFLPSFDTLCESIGASKYHDSEESNGKSTNEEDSESTNEEDSERGNNEDDGSVDMQDDKSKRTRARKRLMETESNQSSSPDSKRSSNSRRGGKYGNVLRRGKA